MEYYVEKYSIMIYLRYGVDFRVNFKIMHILPISSINRTADKHIWRVGNSLYIGQFKKYVEKYSYMIYIKYEADFNVNFKMSINRTADNQIWHVGNSLYIDQFESYVEKYSIMIYIKYEVDFNVNFKMSINRTADKLNI